MVLSAVIASHIDFIKNFMSVRGVSAEYHTLLSMYKFTFIMILYRAQVEQGYTPIFCYKDSHYVQKATDVHIRIYL